MSKLGYFIGGAFVGVLGAALAKVLTDDAYDNLFSELKSKQNQTQENDTEDAIN